MFSQWFHALSLQLSNSSFVEAPLCASSVSACLVRGTVEQWRFPRHPQWMDRPHITMERSTVFFMGKITTKMVILPKKLCEKIPEGIRSLNINTY